LVEGNTGAFLKLTQLEAVLVPSNLTGYSDRHPDLCRMDSILPL